MKFPRLLLCCLLLQFTYAQDIELELFATGLDRPVNIKHAGDDRLFVVEQEGFISIVEADGTVNTTPFLDIDSKVYNIGGIGDERGLLGLAFHPQYATNGYFYVYYINNSGNTVVSRFTRTTDDSADPDSELIILAFNQLFSNHNGGDLAFGPDGYLYIASGDGGSSGDPQNQGQQLNTLLGKLLRIDVDNTAGGNNYAIPADNPFVSNSAALDEIWAYGLRNPWKFSFDRLNNDLWIADVGQFDIEEINRVLPTEAGLNYGWRCYEGNDTFNTAGCPDPSTLTFPVAQYSHFADGAFKCSVTGGYRYRGSLYPTLNGLYFFADYCSDEIGVLEENGATWDRTFLSQSGSNGWTCFGEDVGGEVFVAGIDSGSIYRIIDSSLSVDDKNLSDIEMYPNPVKGILNFNFNGVSLSNVSIYDILGKEILTLDTNGTQELKIDTSNILSGVYIVELFGPNGEKSTKKLIID
ncbi:PQQ-dependent sugar dehydrogenase [Winogradskyella sp. 3972H.M.0a.05]|uniref:PQQ-dependent sugar dehydrogenase n=1 Tax=Winogradskyella sp. 3972H.M.0a.05 TaxID=2950277 RepID=UPI003391A48B